MKKFFFLTTAMLLLFPVTLCMAQITKKQAIDIVMNSIVGDQAESVNVYMESDVQTSQFYVLSPYDSIPAPFPMYWLFFIDLKPLYGWSHPCEYVLINWDNGDTATASKRLPPVNWRTIESVSTPLALTINPPDFNNQSTHLPYPTPNNSLYALMFTGGELGTGGSAFWTAFSHMYCGLREHGFSKENIYVLSNDGNANGNPNNPKMDLDHDQLPDILPDTCNIRNLDGIFAQLQNKMNYGDMLYVFVATHGDSCATDTSKYYFLLYNQEKFSNYQFAEKLQPIHCAQMIINLWSCYSGGFTYQLTKMSNSAKKTILTCINKTPVLRDSGFLQKTGMDRSNYFTCSALRGWHPNVLNSNNRQPWAVTYRVGNMPQNSFDSIVPLPPNAVDTNFDSLPYGGNYNGIQEINEVMNYTKAYDGQFKQYGSKVYDCGFYAPINYPHYPEDLLSLYGITGKVQYSQTVEGNFLIGGKLSIEPGVELTLDTNATFYVFDSAIVVKTDTLKYGTAGKLVMRGATITSANDTNFWQGIEVWGQDSIPRIYPYQAMVQMDSSTIEGARIGISTSAKIGGIPVPHTTGGIITSRTSTFNNNKTALEFLPDTNYSLQSQILQTTFETTDTLRDGTDPYAFAVVDGVQGVGVIFRGCTFKNTTSNAIPNFHNGIGILSRNADFGVQQYTYCKQKITPCPNPVIVPSRFQGLYYGIKSINSTTATLADIQNTYFNNNYRAVYLSTMNYPIITKDTFELPVGTNSNDTCYGLYLDHCSFYTVQEDSLKSGYQSGDTQKTVGMVINHSGMDINEIYNNHFSKVMYGAIAENLNRNPADTTGLCIKCNDFYSTKFDVVVNQQGTNSDWGIARNQGWKRFQTDPAGNTFSKSHLDSTNMLADIDNEDAIFNYFHHNPNTTTLRVEPKFSNINYVVRKPTSFDYHKTIVCQSKLSGGNGSSSEDELKAQLIIQQQSVDSVSSILSALTDGGNSAALNNAVANSDPSESYQIRQQLLGYSPYLSDTVLKTAVQKENVLPNEMIRDILVANPQAPKSEGVMDQLNNRSIPMPDSMLAQIQNGVNILGDKDSLGAVLHNRLQNKHEILFKLVALYKRDTLHPSASHDSLIALLNADHTISSKFQLAFEYLRNNDTSGVRYTLDNIPSQFSLTIEETSLYQSYLTYFGIMNNLAAQRKSITDMSQSQLATMQSLMENGSDPVQSLSRNVLIANNLYSYTEPIILPDETKSAKQKIPIKTGKITTESFMKLLPNPANQYIIVEYNFKDKFNTGQTGEITITTVQGQKIIHKSINKSADQVLITTCTLPVGTYLCTLTLSGNVLETQRFIIVR